MSSGWRLGQILSGLRGDLCGFITGDGLGVAGFGVSGSQRGRTWTGRIGSFGLIRMWVEGSVSV